MEEFKGQIQKEKMIEYVLAGNSTFTLKNEESGNRMTFKIMDIHVADPKVPRGNRWFVKILTSPDNETGYQFIGTLFKEAMGIVFKHSKKSRIGIDALSVKTIQWLIDKLQKGTMPDKMKMYHEGRCGRCGRKLTVPESIESGYGPECITKIFG